ncbi:MAG TPA: NAD(P)H-dependent oxidoreductase [Blastocatellia bacterium]|nr:NAD(P)H-dependent oxidoreductase [Blastocatellia bacterium]
MNDRPIFIPVILGTPRQGRYSEHVARFVLTEVAKRDQVETELIDIREMTISVLDAGEAIKDARFSETAMRADAFISKLIETAYERRFDKFIKELIWMARVLRYGRENVELQ